MNKITSLIANTSQLSTLTDCKFQPLSKYDYLTRESVEIERERLWSKVWLIGPRLELLKKAHDYVVEEFAGESFIFMRGRDDLIRGFYNVCPHRGARIISNDECRGRKPSLLCLYHEWQWDCSGNVQNIPRLDCFPQLAGTDIEKDFRLKEVKVDTWGGWIWYSIDQNIEPLTDYLRPIINFANPYETDRQITIDYSTIEVECNWKVSVENFIETYHLNPLHPQLRDWMDTEYISMEALGRHAHLIINNGSPTSKNPNMGMRMKEFLALNDIDPQSYTGSPQNVRKFIQEAKRARQDEVIEPYQNLTDSQLTETHEFSIFPNITIGFMAESTLVYRHRPHPTDPGRMYIDVTRMCHFDPTTEEIPEIIFKTFKYKDDPNLTDLFEGLMPAPVIKLQLSQDLQLFASVQQGLNSRAFEGFILGEKEKMIKHLHRELSKYIHPTE
ncbi:MAG: aromatic ring-hydroxylating dioxygenase subunit alpha [Symploca sp. SIO3E6]|nr:aromatic ring-hydroxylating dioxygenase subunit alpha [Caldora sp. SIO3E6]